MERIVLFLVAYADMRILPHPDFEWPAPWLTALFERRRFFTAERVYNALLLVFVVGSPGIYSGVIILVGLRIWARYLAAIHPVWRGRLIAPLLVSLSGYAQAEELGDLVFVLILVALICGSAIVKRRR
ncbi:MAG: hypothetical protein ACYTFU_10655, partial [Planctomycetota bacterium]